MCGAQVEAKKLNRKYCDSCTRYRNREASRRFRTSHPGYQREWRQRNRDRVRQYQRKYRVEKLHIRDEPWVADVIRREFSDYRVIINDRKALSELRFALRYMVTQKGEGIVLTRRRLKQAYQLDIYLPELKIAFDIRGIHHFDPSIEGTEGLAEVQERDRQREQLCQSVGILLIVIDVYNYRWTEEELIRYIRRQIEVSNYDDMYSQITAEHDCTVSARQYGKIVVIEEVCRGRATL
jgi:hypothetical protein